MTENRINWKQIFIGLIALAVGGLVYMVDRPPDSAYFFKHIGIDLSRHGIWPNIFGTLGGSLPEFVHPFGFILLTTGVLACGLRSAIGVCAAWLAVDLFFELGQKYDTLFVKFVPAWFDGIPYLENTANCFRHGTFDSMDVAATIFGSAAALFVVWLTLANSAAQDRNLGPV